MKKLKKTIELIIAGGLIMFLFGCQRDTVTTTTTSTTTNINTDGEEASGYDGITEIHLNYDNFSGKEFYMDARVVKITDKGANVEITKRVGPDNYTGYKKEGTIKIDKSKVDELFEILGRYDLQKFTDLPAYGSISTPSRTLILLKGDLVKYDVSFNTHFPETLPPEEDIMYFELFNFFNDIIASEEGWEEVVGDNLPDPRENPAYYERTVTWFGKEVSLVPGTGIHYEDGTGAIIDYEGKNWWEEEGFVGTWKLDEDNPQDVSSASFRVNEDGSVKLIKDGEEFNGQLDDVRRYNYEITLSLDIEGRDRGGMIYLMTDESYDIIRLECYPLPIPETQFDPVDVYLIKE